MPVGADDYAEQTISDTLCALANSGACPPSRVPTCEETLALILDKFVRGGVDLSTMTGEDVEEIVNRVDCAFTGLAVQDVNFDTLKIATLWAVNQA